MTRRACVDLRRLVLPGLLLLAAGCSDAVAREPAREVGGGDAGRGERAIRAYGCGSCHVIPGIAGANGLVGPPLLHWKRRVYIAGQVPNTPDFLIRWIEVPQAIEPETAMPNMRIDEQSARDIAAYLYTIR